MSSFLALLLSLGSFFHGALGAHTAQAAGGSLQASADGGTLISGNATAAQTTYPVTPYQGGTVVGGGPVITAGAPAGCWSYYIGGGTYCNN